MKVNAHFAGEGKVELELTTREYSLICKALNHFVDSEFSKEYNKTFQNEIKEMLNGKIIE